MNNQLSPSSFIGIHLRAKNMKRWPLMACFDVELLSTHIYETSIVAHMLGAIAKTIFNEDIDPDRVASCALFHEAGESSSGIDAPTPVKYRSEKALRMFKELEAEFEQDLLNTLPPELLAIYAPLVQQDADDPHAKLAKAADKITHLLKCRDEVAKHNNEFSKALERAEKLVQRYREDYPSVDYFCQVFLPNATVTLDEQRISSQWLDNAVSKTGGDK